MSIEAIKEALKAGPTEGQWNVGPWFDNDGVRELVIERMTDAGNLCVAVALGGLAGQSANAALIAACNPEAIRSLIERLEAAEKYAARLGWLTKQFRAMSLDMGGNHCWVLARSGSIRGPNMIAAIDSAMQSGGLAEGVE